MRRSTGRSEIGGAAVAITLVDVVVFLPIAFLSGIVGKYMVEFGIVVVVATLFSLFVSFTLTPMLAARWSVVKRSAAPPRSLAWFQNGFDRFTAWYRDRALPYALTHRWLTVGVLRSGWSSARSRCAGRAGSCSRSSSRTRRPVRSQDDPDLSGRHAARQTPAAVDRLERRDHEAAVRARDALDRRRQAGRLRADHRRQRRAA